jgi:CubicO group peptidase (beta-lactamase class C family)
MPFQLPSGSALVAAIAVTIASPAIAAATQPPVAAANRATTELLLEEMRNSRIPGLQVAVVRDGRLVFEGAWGVGDIETGAPVTSDTIFPFNSMTKAFTGVAAMQLVATGKLDLSAPVSRYLPDLPVGWRAITIRQLLTHSSGLPDIVDPDSGALIGAGGEEAAWTAITALPLVSAPGTRSSYNQTNYVLLGRIVDRLAQQPFTAFFRNRQFAPAGMRRTGFGDIRDWAPGKAKSYRFNRPTLSSPGTLERADVEFPPMTRTAAGMEGTAGDMARWIVAVLDGRLVERALLPTMWTPAVLADGTETLRAIGWVTDKRAMNRWVGQSGGNRGAFAVYPDDNVAVVVLTNLQGASPELLLDRVAANYVRGFVLPPVTRLRAEVQKRGFDQLGAIAAELRHADPAITFPERQLSDWGYRMLRSARPQQALAIFTLAASLYPDSANAAENIGYVHSLKGEVPAAIAAYRRALALAPSNEKLASALKALEQR